MYNNLLRTYQDFPPHPLYIHFQNQNLSHQDSYFGILQHYQSPLSEVSSQFWPSDKRHPAIYIEKI